MNKTILKTWLLSCIIALVCFSFAACGNQDDAYNPDEVTNNGTDNTADNGSLGQDIENIGDDIMDGAEDLLDGSDTDMNQNQTGTTQNNSGNDASTNHSVGNDMNQTDTDNFSLEPSVEDDTENENGAKENKYKDVK